MDHPNHAPPPPPPPRRAIRKWWEQLPMASLSTRRPGIANPATASCAVICRPPEIGPAHVLTPVTNSHLVCRLLLEKYHFPLLVHSHSYFLSTLYYLSLLLFFVLSFFSFFI